MNSWQHIWIVFSKEARDNLRDRRSMFSALGSSLVGPVILLVVIVLVGKSVFKDVQGAPLKLAVSGAQNAPNLILFLEQNGVEIQEPPADLEGAVRNGDLDMVLVIPESYSEDFSSGHPASVRIVLDSSRQSASAFVERARNLINAYNNQIAAVRLLARGINPEVIHPLAVERVDVATPQSQAVIFLNMMPYFVVLVVFLGGMYVIIDTTAGERERGSLEPLLINPVTRAEFVLGKLTSALPFAMFAVFTTLMAFYLTFNYFPLEDYIGFQLTLSGPAMAGIFLLALPMILLASALQMIIATFTRSFKEAQTYVSFLPLVPALPGIGLAFLPIKPSLWIMLIPTFGQQLLINQLMRGEPISGINVLVSTLATLAVAVILILLAIRLYKQERVLFGST